MSRRTLFALLSAVALLLALTASLANAAENIVRLSAARDGARVRIAWETVSEADSAEFRVYRSVTATSRRALIATVPAQHPGEAAGASYDFTDDTAIDPDAVYWLAEIAANGEATLHGPLTPQTGGPNAVTATSLAAARITPNALLYIAALVLLAAALWAVVYRLGPKRA